LKVYILHSSTLGKFYVSQTQNLEDRLVYHNNGFAKYTKLGVPRELIWSVKCTDRSEAMKLEKKIKKLGSDANRSLSKYLQEISRFEPLLPQREVELAILVKQGNRLALKELTEANLRFVVSVAKDYQGQGLPLTDLINEGNLELSLNARNAPDLHISREYDNMLKGYAASKDKSKSQKDAILFIKQKLDSAKWFIDAVKQRQQTLLLTMNTIMLRQKEYFLTGDERKLKPMILKDIATIIDMDISTVSRVANSKYVSTPYGTKLIKEFFSESMKNTEGEDVSTIEIKNTLETIITKESKKKPYTDDKLAALLKEKGYPIARRTVAKYREQLDIPVARLRKEL